MQEVWSFAFARLMRSKSMSTKKPFRIERWTGKDWRYCTSTSANNSSADKARQLGAEWGGCSMRVLNTNEAGWPETYSLQGADDAVFASNAYGLGYMQGRGAS